MSTRDEQIARFWSNCLPELEKAQVRPDARRWHVLRMERFLAAIQPRRQAELSAWDVLRYRSEAERDGSLAAWPFVQIVGAIRSLGVAAARAELIPWIGGIGGLGADAGRGSSDGGAGLGPGGRGAGAGGTDDRPGSGGAPGAPASAGLRRGGLGLLPVFAGGAWDKGYLGVWLVVGRRGAPIRTPAAACESRTSR